MAKIDVEYIRKIISERPDLFAMEPDKFNFNPGMIFRINFIKYEPQFDFQKVFDGNSFDKALDIPFITVYPNHLRYYSGFQNITNESFEKIFNKVDDDYRIFFFYHLDVFTEQAAIK